MLPNSKLIVGLDDHEVTAGQTVTCVIDRTGYDYAIIDVILSAKENTTPPTVIKLAELDSGTSYTDISAFTGGTGFTLPTTQTTVGAAPTVVRMCVDLKKRKKTLRTSVAAATNSCVVVTANLFRGKDFPATATLGNVNTLVVG